MDSMTAYPRLAQRLYNTPLLIEPGKAEVIESVFRSYLNGADGRQFEVEARQPAAAGPVPMTRTDDGYYMTDTGVAVLPVYGTLVQRAGGLDALSGLQSYQRVARMHAAADANPDVRAHVMELDTPGGEAAGLFDLGAQLVQSTKPVYAHANEMAFSAGYALAAAAQGGLFMPQAAMVGSVGVVMMHVDQSKADAKRGYVYTPVYAGARKVDFSSHAPLSPRALATAQAEVDRMYSIFVDFVASSRSIDAASVRGTEAALLAPGQAIDLRMADGVETLAETIQRAADESAPRSFYGYGLRADGAVHSKEASMAERKDAPANQPAQGQLYTSEQIAEIEAKANAAGTAAGITKGTADERARIVAILDAPEAAKRMASARHLALKTSQTPADAIALLATMPETTSAAADPLAAAMQGQPNPALGPGSDTENGGQPPKRRQTSADVYDMRAKVTATRRGQAA